MDRLPSVLWLSTTVITTITNVARVLRTELSFSLMVESILDMHPQHWSFNLVIQEKQVCHHALSHVEQTFRWSQAYQQR
jgi:hypothetical protein